MQRLLKLGMAAFKKKLRVLHRARIDLLRSQLLHTRSQAAMNVVLQTGPRMIPRQIHLAAWNQKAAMDQLDHPIGKIARKIRPVISRAILAQPPCHKYLGKPVSQRQLHIRIGLVVPQKDIEPRLALLDQIVFERQRLHFVGHADVVHIHSFAHQCAGLGIGLAGCEQVAPHPRAQIARLADIDHLALGVLVQIHAGLSGEGPNFLVKIHTGSAQRSIAAVSSLATAT